MKAYFVMSEVGGQVCNVGTVAQNRLGWKFTSKFTGKCSRNYQPSAEAALKGKVTNYTLQLICGYGEAVR